MRAAVTVVMPVKNERSNIAAAIGSVNWAQRVVVVDSQSQDGTAEIAASLGADVVQFSFDGGGPKKKRWSLRNLDFRTPYVLFLDADERVTPSLRDEIIAAVRRGDADGWYIDREFRFLGRELRSFRPNWNLRLFRPELARLEEFNLEDLPETGDNEIHEHFLLDGKTAFLRAPLLHDDYRGIGPWILRHERYATWEAAVYDRYERERRPSMRTLLLRHTHDPVQRNRELRRLWVRLPAKPLLRFLLWYLGKGGVRDGYPGLVYCVLMGWYELVIGLKRRERAKDKEAS